MPRIFVPPEQIKANTAELSEQDAKKLLKVLRLVPGDTVILFDGRKEYLSEIVSIGTKSATLKIISEYRKTTESPIQIYLGQGVPKGEKLEWTVQKAVELGVAHVIPVHMERSVKRPDAAGMENMLKRLRRIAIEAARQSGRIRVPDIPAYMDLQMFLTHTMDADLKILFYEEEKTAPLRPVLNNAGKVKTVALLVGPEGGLTRDEAEEAKESGFVIAGFGPRTLRTETAGIAAITIIQYELGDIG